MKSILVCIIAALGIYLASSCVNKSSTTAKIVSEGTMQEIYEEIQTPFKYGVVFQHPDTTKLIDSPTIFRENDSWYMTYIVFDGQGYETWLAESEDLDASGGNARFKGNVSMLVFGAMVSF